MLLSPKQVDLMKWLATPTQPIMGWAGSTGSGKSFGAAVGFVAHTKRYIGERFLVCGSTVQSAERNLLGHIEEAARLCRVTYDYRRNTHTAYVGGNRLEFYGGNNEASARLIQGATAAGVWLDETTLLPESFATMAISRARVTGAISLLTFNKGGPMHWLKQLIDKPEFTIDTMESDLDDAPWVTPAQRKLYDAAFHGHQRKRMIDNEWAAATGLVHPEWYTCEYTQPKSADLCADWGTASVTAALLMGHHGSHYAVDGEYYYDASTRPQRSPEEHAEAILSMVPEGVKILRCIADPSATSLILALRRKGMPVHKGNNDVLRGLQATTSALASRKVLVTDRAPMTAKELMTYAWDAKAAQLGEDKPVKAWDHTLDALRYWIMLRLPPILDMTWRPKPRGL